MGETKTDAKTSPTPRVKNPRLKRNRAEAFQPSTKIFWISFSIAGGVWAFMRYKDVPNFVCVIVSFFIALMVQIIARYRNLRPKLNDSSVGGLDCGNKNGFDFLSQFGSDKNRKDDSDDFIEEMANAYKVLNEFKNLPKDVPNAWQEETEQSEQS